MEIFIPLLFFLSLIFNFRAVVKLLIDWKGMVITKRFIQEEYNNLDTLPSDEDVENNSKAPIFLHLLAAYEEPEITRTLDALLNSTYPHSKIRFTVITKEEEERTPNPLMGISTGKIIEQYRDSLPPYKQKILYHLTMPQKGRKAHQLNWALREENLREILGSDYEAKRIFVGVSDADSIPDMRAFKWIAREEMEGRNSYAYQGVTFSLSNYVKLDTRGKIAAIQQSSIFIRVSIARLINEAKRVALIKQFSTRFPALYGILSPLIIFFFRRSLICLGHNQFIRLDILKKIGLFPTIGATEDSTLGYILGMKDILIKAMPIIELNDIPETKEKIVRQSARWYKGVLDDAIYLKEAYKKNPSAYNLAQFLRHMGNKVIEWPTAAIIYPVMGYLGWHLAVYYQAKFWLFVLALFMPSAALVLTILVGGIITYNSIEILESLLPKKVPLNHKTLSQKLLMTFRCQSYWLLATRGSWRVLWQLLIKRRYEVSKTDRVTQIVHSSVK